MQLRFLMDLLQLEMHFSSLTPLFERVVCKATKGEFDIENLYRLAQQGHITVGMIEQGWQVQWAIVFEFIAYPQFYCSQY